MTYKYVMFELNSTATDLKQLVPVIFPQQVAHSDLTDRLRSMFQREGNEVRIHSAGFIELHCRGVHGKSETLDLGSDPEDTSVINNFPYFSGFV